MQGCSHPEQQDPAAALRGEFVPGMLETLLKDESAGSARGKPSPCSRFGSVGSRGASGVAGMAPTLSLEPFPQLQREVEPPPAVASLLRLRGWIPVLPLLPQDGVTWNGSQGWWGPSRAEEWGGPCWEQGDKVGPQLGAGNQCGTRLGEEGQGGTQIHPGALCLFLAEEDEEAAEGEHLQECPAPCHCHPPAAPSAIPSSAPLQPLSLLLLPSLRPSPTFLPPSSLSPFSQYP